MEPAVRLVRLVQIAMLVSIAMYVLVGEMIGRTVAPSSTMFYALSFISISTVGAIVVVRRTLILPSEALLREKPGDSTLLTRWKTGYIATYVLCEALALFGLILRLVGFTLADVRSFYLGAFVLLLLCSPRAARKELG
jgi:hypothetical protein